MLVWQITSEIVILMRNSYTAQNEADLKLHFYDHINLLLRIYYNGIIINKHKYLNDMMPRVTLINTVIHRGLINVL